MFLELHLLQNFAPSNLNRDDTGAPKDCEFGGYRRARISSQCLKRAIRTTFQEQSLLPKYRLASRTKRLVDEVVKRLQAQGKSEAEARPAVEIALVGLGLGLTDEGRTEYLLFLGEAEIDAVAQLCADHWDELTRIASATAKVSEDKVPADLKNALREVLDGGSAVDLALFGRMIADLPDRNVDAACQVAHAMSTNRVSMEFDFYTAVDDLLPEDTSGAGMLGTVEFNSACFYRYANIDLVQLQANLQGNEDLARQALEAFLRACIISVPTGKQNSMAAQNPPSLVFAVVRGAGLWSLANAFVRPVRPDQEGDLVQNSIVALDRFWAQLASMYGEAGIVGKWLCTLEKDRLQSLQDAWVDNVDELVQQILSVVAFDGGIVEAKA